MTLQIEVDLSSSVPPYEQIRSQVVAHVSAERLRVGDRLPTIRALATDLGVAAGTVARAYRELEQAGIVATRRRSGTVVADGAVAADVLTRQAARLFVETVRAARLSDDEIVDLVRGALLDPVVIAAPLAGTADVGAGHAARDSTPVLDAHPARTRQEGSDPVQPEAR